MRVVDPKRHNREWSAAPPLLAMGWKKIAS
jgi:hypothetical protein